MYSGQTNPSVKDSRLSLSCFSDNTLQYVVLDELREVLFIGHANVTDLMNCFIEQAPVAKLHQQDFPHMESETQLLTGYLSQMQNVGAVSYTHLELWCARSADAGKLYCALLSFTR